VNKFTGTVHDPSGKRVFPNGHPVSGVNEWSQITNGVLSQTGVLSNLLKDPVEEKKEEKKEEQKEPVFNKFDGLNHFNNGST
jgi:hypothetical protein